MSAHLTIPALFRWHSERTRTIVHASPLLPMAGSYQPSGRVRLSHHNGKNKRGQKRPNHDERSNEDLFIAISLRHRHPKQHARDTDDRQLEENDPPNMEPKRHLFTSFQRLIVWLTTVLTVDMINQDHQGDENYRRHEAGQNTGRYDQEDRDTCPQHQLGYKYGRASDQSDHNEEIHSYHHDQDLIPKSFHLPTPPLHGES